MDQVNYSTGWNPPAKQETVNVVVMKNVLWYLNLVSLRLGVGSM